MPGALPRFLCLVLLAIPAALGQDTSPTPPPPSPSTTPSDLAAIVKRAIDREIGHQRRLAEYTWQEEEIVRVGDHSRKRKLWDHFAIDGSTYKRLVARDGQPLPPDQAKREQEKMDREIAKRRAESPEDRRKRLAKEQKERDEAIRFREEVIQAFDFRLEGEEIINGYPAWRIAGTPRTGFRPRSRDGKVLAKIRGRIWVHRESGEWLKYDVETLDKLTFGWVVASVAPGARFISEQMRVNDEFWHPHLFRLQMKARGLWVKIDLDVDQRYRGFRRFSADSRLVEVEGAAGPGSFD